MYNTRSIPENNSSIPPLSEAPTAKSGPSIRKIKTRALVIYALMCAVGIIPALLTLTGLAEFSPKVQAAFMGLWFPGAGLIAVGSVWCILLGLITYLLVLKYGGTIWGMPAIVLIILYLWAVSLAAGGLTADINVPWYSVVIILAVTAVTIISKSRSSNKIYKENLEKRKLHEGYLEEEASRLQKEAVAPQPAENRELDEAAVKAARYLFEKTLREPGDFEGYESADQIITSALRYSLDFLGYSLSMLQCMYTPNFHGYLNKAQRFIIESFTLPEVCGYWKWEYLSSLRWNPDPVKNLNIMFTGWSGLVINLYGANTGDLRYEAPGALKFKPYFKKDITYDYSSKDIVEAIVRNWNTYPTRLFPCEPHLTFPQCNTFAMDAVLAYDRHHNTNYLKDLYPVLDKELKENFILPSGDFPFVHNTLLGFSSLVEHPPRFDATNAFIIARILNSVYPGLAKRTYMFALKDFVHYKDGEIAFHTEKWDYMLDEGNLKVSPAYIIGIIATAACELGDMKTVRDLLEVADKYMERLDDTSVFAYKKASVIGNALITSARFAQKDDLYNTIHKGPGTGALNGPILSDCRYPNVLVARAFSDGNDLDLVLYNGVTAGREVLGIGRLKPGKAYKIKGTATDFTADREGNAKVEVLVDGRTKIHIIPN